MKTTKNRIVGLGSAIALAVPLAFASFGIDPALAPSVVVTTCTDTCGFFYFLSVGALLLARFGLG